MQAAPIIVTLKLDAPAHDYFTNMRNQYFPKNINYLEAHVSLFHHLPPNEPLVQQVLQNHSERSDINLSVTGIKNIGNGTAFIIASAELQAMHKSMQQSLQSYLIPQDKQKLWPHITVQNKVTALAAGRTTDFLNQDFKPFTIQAIGLIEWLYLNGPWKKKAEYLFG